MKFAMSSIHYSSKYLFILKIHLFSMYYAWFDLIDTGDGLLDNVLNINDLIKLWKIPKYELIFIHKVSRTKEYNFLNQWFSYHLSQLLVTTLLLQHLEDELLSSQKDLWVFLMIVLLEQWLGISYIWGGWAKGTPKVEDIPSQSQEYKFM